MVEELDLVNHNDGAAKEAFRVLLDTASPVALEALAERVGDDAANVRQVFDRLVVSGRAQVEGDLVLGIYGLTLRPTPYRLAMGTSVYFTWCAWDIIGIPAALGASAEVTGECAECHTAIRLTITLGEPPPSPIVVSWPSERCDSVREEFCPAVNFYCTAAHYEAAAGTGQAPANAITLERAAQMGRENWGWAR